MVVLRSKDKDRDKGDLTTLLASCTLLLGNLSFWLNHEPVHKNNFVSYCSFLEYIKHIFNVFVDCVFFLNKKLSILKYLEESSPRLY